jgi:predicted acetyltransferase
VDTVTPVVRTITADEIATYATTMAIGFSRHRRDEELETRRKLIDPARTHAAFDGDAMVGTARSFPTPLTLPGCGTVQAAAVTNVTVLPTHRRQGALTGMMAAQLDDVAAREEPLAILIASESQIYARYGYGVATRHAALSLDTAYARFVDDTRDLPLPVAMVDAAEGRRRVPAIYERFRKAQPGSIGRVDLNWDMRFNVVPHPAFEDVKDSFFVLAGDEGYATYRVKDKWEGRMPASTVVVDELVATSRPAYVTLWRYLIGLDWVTTVEAADRPPAEPLPLLLRDARRARITDLTDFLWARLLDVPAALGARAYSCADRLVLEVVDAFRPDGRASGRFAVEGSPEGASCASTDEGADITLGVDDLGAAYLGDTPLCHAAGAGRVDEHTAGAVRRFDAMFVTEPPPWCNTWF